MKCTAPKSHRTSLLGNARHSFAGTPENVSVARAWVEATLRRWGRETPDMLPLIVSELATNAITHSLSGHPDGKFTIRLALTVDHIRVTVRDAGPKPGRTPTLRTPTLTAKHGRGLALVDTLSRSWGALTIGTGVYAEVPL